MPAIFTDEPNFRTKKPLNFAADKHGIIIPYTTDFEETFKAAYGVSVEDNAARPCLGAGRRRPFSDPLLVSRPRSGTLRRSLRGYRQENGARTTGSL